MYSVSKKLTTVAAVEIEIIKVGDNNIVTLGGIIGRRSKPDLNNGIVRISSTILDRIFPDNRSLLEISGNVIQELGSPLEPDFSSSDVVLLGIFNNASIGFPTIGINFVTTRVIESIGESLSTFLDNILNKLVSLITQWIELTSGRLSTIIKINELLSCINFSYHRYCYLR